MPISTIGSNSLNQTSDLTINGQTVGKGGGNASTNTVHGVSALAATNTIGNCTAIGYQALTLTTGKQNTAVGSGAGASMTTGEGLAAFGWNAANLNTADNVTALGHNTLGANTTGANNTAVGNAALNVNTTGSSNTAVGRQALVSNTTASNNTAVGYQAGYSNTTGYNNTAIGQLAGYNLTTGYRNTLIGVAAGSDSGSTQLTTGYQNIVIGWACDVSNGNGNNQIVLGADTTAKGDNTGFINPNGGGVYQGNNSGSWSTTSDQRLKKNIVDNTDGLDKITSVRVRNFEYRLPEEVTELDEHCAVPNTGVQLGVIAQELQVVLPDCVKTESTGVLSVDPDNLTWYMVNAIKDLKALVDAQAAEIAELKAKVA
jgi:hypothetical protein